MLTGIFIITTLVLLAYVGVLLNERKELLYQLVRYTHKAATLSGELEDARSWMHWANEEHKKSEAIDKPRTGTSECFDGTGLERRVGTGTLCDGCGENVGMERVIQHGDKLYHYDRGCSPAAQQLAAVAPRIVSLPPEPLYLCSRPISCQCKDRVKQQDAADFVEQLQKLRNTDVSSDAVERPFSASGTECSEAIPEAQPENAVLAQIAQGEC